MRPWAGEGLAIGVALVAWCGIGLQLWLSLRLAAANGQGTGRGLVIFLSYFTVLTNVLVAATTTTSLLLARHPVGRWCARPGVVTGVTAAILLVGIAYHLLLARIWNPTGWQLVADVILHTVTPVACALHWWLRVAGAALHWRQMMAWALYPVAYFAYAMLHGAITGWYPYYFIDADALGYGGALTNALGVLVGYLAIAVGLIGASRLAAPATR